MIKSKTISTFYMFVFQMFTLCFSTEIQQIDDKNITVGHKIEVPKGLSQHKRKDSYGYSYYTNSKTLDISYCVDSEDHLQVNNLMIDEGYSCSVAASAWHSQYINCYGLSIDGKSTIKGTLTVNCYKNCLGGPMKEQGGIKFSKVATIAGGLIINGSLLDYHSNLNIQKGGIFKLKSDTKEDDSDTKEGGTEKKYHAGIISSHGKDISFYDGSTFDVSELESFQNIKLSQSARLNFLGGSTIKLPCIIDEEDLEELLSDADEDTSYNEIKDIGRKENAELQYLSYYVANSNIVVKGEKKENIFIDIKATDGSTPVTIVLPDKLGGAMNLLVSSMYEIIGSEIKGLTTEDQLKKHISDGFKTIFKDQMIDFVYDMTSFKWWSEKNKPSRNTKVLIKCNNKSDEDYYNIWNLKQAISSFLSLQTKKVEATYKPKSEVDIQKAKESVQNDEFKKEFKQDFACILSSNSFRYCEDHELLQEANPKLSLNTNDEIIEAFYEGWKQTRIKSLDAAIKRAVKNAQKEVRILTTNNQDNFECDDFYFLETCDD